jgi:4-alpha-glucanotransferase
MIRAVLSAKVLIAIFPMQDILGLGSKARMNVPGKSKGNWQWRLNKKSLTLSLAQKMRRLTQIYQRSNL